MQTMTTHLENPIWSVERDAVNHLVHVALDGTFHPQLLRQIFADALLEAKCHRALRLLVDARQMQPALDSVFEILGLPSAIARFSVPRNFQMAFIRQPCVQKPQLFLILQSFCNSCGLAVRFFSELEGALNWLRPDVRKAIPLSSSSSLSTWLKGS